MPMGVDFPKIGQFKTAADLRAHLSHLGVELPIDDQILSSEQGSPMAEPIVMPSCRIGNRWCIHPMEGWDGERDGRPSALTLRRWQRFGQSGAKLIWGGEAAAVREDGRANPRQVTATPSNRDGLQQIYDTLVSGHRDSGEQADDLLVGLQLTHSGRFSRPHKHERLEPRIAYHHPWLDAMFGISSDDPSVVWSDDELAELIDDYVAAAGVAYEVGFRFVDIKSCHGYLLHEFLSARDRPDAFGGSLEGRCRLLRSIIERIRAELPELLIGVRLSVFDSAPPHISASASEQAGYLFGALDRRSQAIAWDEPLQLVSWLRDWGVSLINVTAGSPYYCPHVQRPAAFPPSDGYPPPEDPLVGVARLLSAARRCKRACPELVTVGTGFTYLQDYAVHAAQAVVREGWMDAVGIGRMVLSYPELPSDTLAGRLPKRKQVCRTFSDCTTAPRQGWVSGCYPLDPFYKSLPEALELKRWKRSARGGEEMP